MLLKLLQIPQEPTCVGVSFNKIPAVTLVTRDSNTGIFLWNMRHFKNTYFVEHSRMAASDKYLNPYQIQVLEVFRSKSCLSKSAFQNFE